MDVDGQGMQRAEYRSFLVDSSRWDAVELRPGDVVVCTPSKSGTTWMQTLVSLLLHDGWPDAGVQALSPWVDLQLLPLEELQDFLATQPGRRVLKTHTPPDGLLDLPGVDTIVVARDPRDVLGSMIDHDRNNDHDLMRQIRAQVVGQDEFSDDDPHDLGDGDVVEHFLLSTRTADAGGNVSLDHVTHHLRLAWERRERPDWHLFHFADLLDDLAGEAWRLAGLLQVDLDEDRVTELAMATTLDRLRTRATETAPGGDVGVWRDVPGFFAAGRRGTGVELLDEQQQERYEERVATLLPDNELRQWVHFGRLETGVDVGG
jgi:aryl sulfotransferase